MKMFHSLRKLGIKAYVEATVITGSLLTAGSVSAASSEGFDTGGNVTESSVKLTDVVNNSTSFFKVVLDGLFVFAVLAGVFYLLMGIWGFSKGKQESQQEGMGKHLKQVLVGVSLCSIGLIVKIIATSLFTV